MLDDRAKTSENSTLLRTEKISVTFGGLMAVDEVSLKVRPGEIFGIIGPNGAGKTTLFNAISGLTTAATGSIFFKNKDITHLPTWQRIRMGMARTFQNLRLFQEMTVFQTVLIGRYPQRQANGLSHLIGLRQARADEKTAREETMSELEFVGMVNYRDWLVTNLPYGHRRRVEIARALATEPSLLLLDEPAAGMTSQEANELIEIINRVRERGITVVLVEHHMHVVMSICNRIAVLNYGAEIAQGTPSEVQNNTAVIEAYLGKGKRRARA